MAHRLKNIDQQATNWRIVFIQIEKFQISDPGDWCNRVTVPDHRPKIKPRKLKKALKKLADLLGYDASLYSPSFAKTRKLPKRLLGDL